MGEPGRGRYGRSRYGSHYGSGDRPRRSSGRYYDSFFEDMLIPEDGPIQRENADSLSSESVDGFREFDGRDGHGSGRVERWESCTGLEGPHRAGDDSGLDSSGFGRDRSDLNNSGMGDATQNGVGDDGSVFNRIVADEGHPNSNAPDAPDVSDASAPIGPKRIERMYSRKAAKNKAVTSASKKRLPRFKLGRAGFVVAVLTAAVALVGTGVAFAFVSGVADNLHAGVDDNLRAALVKTDMANEPFYMLLLGTDGSAERDKDPTYGGGYRSDSMMLARIDPVQKKATLVSIGRDIMVDLGGDIGEQKINAAHAFGGPALAVKAVSEFAGVPISHFAQVDFDGFSAMVDALGGVQVDVPMAIVDDYDAGGSVPGGLQTLDGAQALILCRARNSYASISAHPDEMRAANQRLVLSAIARKLLDSDVATIASTVQAMSSYVITDLELTDIIGLAQIMRGLNPDTDIYTASVPTTSEYADAIWYEYVSKDAWSKMMRRVDAGEPPVDEAIIDEATGTVLATAGAGATSTADKLAVVTVKNATDISGLAASLRAKLVEAGFVNAAVGDIAPGYQYPDTLVIYDEPGRAREAAEIVSAMGQGEAMQNDGSYLLLDTDFLVVIGEDWDTSK